jgi:hypothetical protein
MKLKHCGRAFYKSVLCLLFFMSFQTNGSGQQINWVVSDTAQYAFNTAYASVAAVSGNNNEVFSAWMELFSFNYSQDLLGTYVVNSIDALGAKTLLHQIGPVAVVRSLKVRPNGDLIVSGTFMDSLVVDGATMFHVTQATQFARNAFVICYDSNGTLRWSRNLSSSLINLEEVDADAIDQNGNYWFAYMGFSSSNPLAVCVSESGQDSVTRVLPGIQSMLSDIVFDATGAMYLSGGIGSGNFSFGGLPVTITTAYNRFLAKMDLNGNGLWFNTIPDLTFSKNHIVIDDSAGIYLTGDLYDSVTVGGILLNGPNWVYDFLTVKYDSTGHIIWARDVPYGTSITGDLQLGSGRCIAISDNGYYQLVSYRGMTDYGNGQMVGGPSIQFNRGLSLLYFDKSGNLISHLDIPTSNGLWPYSILTNNSVGYITGTANGSQQIGPIAINTSTNSTFFSWLAQFDASSITGIGFNDKRNSITIFPSPSMDGKIQFNYLPEHTKVEIFDMNGRLRRKFYSSENSGFDTALPSGIYLVKAGEKFSSRWTIIR